MKERLVTWDIAKGLCIILVVIGHYYPENAPEWYSAIHNFIYSFHMPVFLFISGFIYMATQKDVPYGTFVMKKVKRLIIPYISTSVIIIALKLVSQSFLYVENPVTCMSFTEILYKPAAGYFLWFIWVLWLAFLIVPFFDTVKRRLLLFAFSAAIYIVPFDLGSLGEYFCLREFKEMFVFFTTGMLSYDFKEKISRLAPLRILFIAAFLVSEFIYLFHPGIIDAGVLKFATSVLGIYTVYAVSKAAENRRTCGILVRTGAMSYMIYLFHTTFEGFAKGVIDKTGWLSLSGSDIGFTVNAAFVVAAGIIAPLLLQRYVFQRFRTTRFLFGLK